MDRNQEWTTLDDKAPGDKITLVVSAASYYKEGTFPDRLCEGSLVKTTKATRTYTMPGAIHDGNVQLRAGQWRCREAAGLAQVGDTRVKFRVATPTDIARLTDPNRALREAFDDALRDLRHFRAKTTRHEISGVAADLRAALNAADALLAALPAETQVDA